MPERKGDISPDRTVRTVTRLIILVYMGKKLNNLGGLDYDEGSKKKICWLLYYRQSNNINQYYSYRTISCIQLILSQVLSTCSTFEVNNAVISKDVGFIDKIFIAK